MRIPYFVFTNGEDGENMMDWGVKHSSVALGNRRALDSEYKSLLGEFGLSWSLNDTLPAEGKADVLLLPYSGGRVLMEYVFRSRDHKGRDSNSRVVCVIPTELQEGRVREVARRLWSSNDLAKIAQHGSKRLDSLEYSDSAKTEGMFPFVVKEWPGDDTAYLSSGSNVKSLGREVVDEPEVVVAPEPKPKLPVLAAVAVIAVIGVLAAGTLGISWYMKAQRRKAEEARIAREERERERLAQLESERRAQEEAQRLRDNQDQELAGLERRVREAEGYLSDMAESAKFIASSVIKSIDALDVVSEFAGRTAALRSRAQGITSRADEIIRAAEEARARRAEEEARRRRDSERQRVKRIADSVIAGVKGVHEIEGFPLVSADNFLPPSGNETDTPFGKMKVCRIGGDYAFLDAEALKRALMSFCGEEYVSNIPDKYFVFAFSPRTKEKWDNRLRSLESEVFMNVDSIRPFSETERMSSTLNLEDYITRAVSTLHQQNFRLFFRGEGDEYIIVFANSSGTPEVYLGTKRNVKPVMKREFMRELKDSAEISERQGSIAFYLKREDEKLRETSGADGKFELLINQLADSGGTK